MNISESNAAVHLLQSLHDAQIALTADEARWARVLLVSSAKTLHMSWPDLRAWLDKATT